MDSGELSLSNLNDITLPEPPLFWPPAPGGLVLLCVGGIFIVLIAFRLYAQWAKNAYRREALLLLRDVTTSYEISVLLKRVALVAYRRNQVASLFGSGWVNFLNKTCPQARFSQHFFNVPGQEPPPEQIHEASVWIKKHNPKIVVLSFR